MEADNCLLSSQGGTISCMSQTANSTIVVAPKAEIAIREIKQGEELNTYYKEDFFPGKIVSFVSVDILVTDLIAKFKVIRMKQFGVDNGCTLCTKRGTHLANNHQ